jgi:hypothetical protein
MKGAVTRADCLYRRMRRDTMRRDTQYLSSYAGRLPIQAYEERYYEERNIVSLLIRGQIAYTGSV